MTVCKFSIGMFEFGSSNQVGKKFDVSNDDAPSPRFVKFKSIAVCPLKIVMNVNVHERIDWVCHVSNKVAVYLKVISLKMQV